MEGEVLSQLRRRGQRRGRRRRRGGQQPQHGGLGADAQDPCAEIAPRPAIDELVLLSFGTGAAANYAAGQRLDWGIAQWGAPLINIMIDGVAGVATYQCRQIPRERFHRVQPIFPPDNPIGLDQWQKRDELVALAKGYDLRPTITWLEESWI